MDSQSVEKSANKPSTSRVLNVAQVSILGYTQFYPILISTNGRTSLCSFYSFQVFPTNFSDIPSPMDPAIMLVISH